MRLRIHTQTHTHTFQLKQQLRHHTEAQETCRCHVAAFLHTHTRNFSHTTEDTHHHHVRSTRATLPGHDPLTVSCWTLQQRRAHACRSPTTKNQSSRPRPAVEVIRCQSFVIQTWKTGGVAQNRKTDGKCVGNSICTKHCGTSSSAVVKINTV